MKPKVSVLLCTYRMGGLDITFEGLAHQTFPYKDWELILVDVHHKRRRDKVKQYLKQKHFAKKIPLVHMAPMRSIYPEDNGSMHRNSAIMLAEGELCIFLCDFAYVQADWIQRHWDVYHDCKPGGTTAMSPHRYWRHPPTKLAWHRANISLFRDPFSPHYFGYLEQQKEGQDPKLDMPAGGISGNYFHFKNEAVKLDTLLEINGADENYEHLYSDVDMGERCCRTGNGFVLDPHNIAEIIQVRDFYPALERKKTYEQDHAYFIGRQISWDTGNLQAPNDFNIQDLRKIALKKKRWGKSKT